MDYNRVTSSFKTKYLEDNIASLLKLYLLKGKNLHNDTNVISCYTKVKFYDRLLDCFGGIP